MSSCFMVLGLVMFQDAGGSIPVESSCGVTVLPHSATGKEYQCWRDNSNGSVFGNAHKQFP